MSTTKTIIIAAMAWAGTAVADDSKTLDVSVVAPGVVSSAAQEFGATQSPDGNSLYYTLSDNGYTHMTIMVSPKFHDNWQSSKVATFSGQWNDADPSFRPDGKRIYFISNRPVGGKFTNILEIWYVEKDDHGRWGEAQSLADDLGVEGYKSYPSVAANGSLYFAHSRTQEVYVSRLVNGKHQKAEAIQVKTNAPSIAPDQSFIIIGQRGPGPRDENLAIRYFRDGQWSEPMALAKPINSASRESSPNISADGKTLFFTSTRLDYGSIKWPREKILTEDHEIRGELNAQWQNGLRNIYKVNIEQILKSK